MAKPVRIGRRAERAGRTAKTSLADLFTAKAWTFTGRQVGKTLFRHALATTLLNSSVLMVAAGSAIPGHT